MNTYQKAVQAMKDLFAKDYQFALATSKDNVPSLRYVDTYYDEGDFYIVTYAKSQKVQEIENNCNISLCRELYRFSGKAYNIGHPFRPENKDIREKLIQAFEPWYFAHNNEQDENMCYVKVELSDGFVYKDGTGYRVDFQSKKAEEFPFECNIVTIS